MITDPTRCMCGATDCKSCGPAQGYRTGSIDETELHRKVEQAIEDAYTGKDGTHENYIAELFTTLEIPHHMRGQFYGHTTFYLAALQATWRGDKEKAYSALEMLEGRIRQKLADYIEPAIIEELEE